jgi:hypothetical protein
MLERGRPGAARPSGIGNWRLGWLLVPGPHAGYFRAALGAVLTWPKGGASTVSALSVRAGRA